MTQYDAVVIGGGPAGSVFASRLASRGRSVLVLEKGRHPRFHLGESLLPASMHVLQAIGVFDQVLDTFMVKRGARFVRATGGPDAPSVRYDFSEAFNATHEHAFQVPRDEFDALLFRRAGACGAELREGVEATRIVFEGDRAVGVEARAEDGTRHAFTGRVIVDASGRDALQARAERSVDRIPHLDRTALYSQFEGTWRDTGRQEGDIQIVVFGEGEERGWFWVIPFRDGRTSVGAVVSSAWIRARQRPGGPPALFAAALEEAPTVAWMIQGARQTLAPGATADFSFRVRSLSGNGWLRSGDAGGFLDPLFSTGAHMAMHGSLLAADVIDERLASRNGNTDVNAEHLADWERQVRAGGDLFLGAVQNFYAGDLVKYLFAEPQHPFLRRAITSMLSGYVFTDAVWSRDMKTRFPPQL